MGKAQKLIKRLTVGEAVAPPAKKQKPSSWHARPMVVFLQGLRVSGAFLRANWKGALVILLVTLWFFWPIVTRIDSYSEGGDAMFNAWTLARDHHCLMGEGCPTYTDGNIYFPHKDSMLYSETQLSAGLLTLPLHWINDNPLFAYNIWTIASVFLGGFCMYLLAKYLSRGREIVSTAAGLVFAFAPFKMAAVFHLQNLSIFYLPLSALLLFKYFDTSKRRYLVGLFVALTLQNYASWYNLVFTGAAIALLVVGLWLSRLVNRRQVLLVAMTMLASYVAILPLAIGYMRFSKETGATFGIKDQTLYSSSVADYLLPFNGAPLGHFIDSLDAGPYRNGYNLDSYSYHGFTLYILAGAMLVVTFLRRKDSGRAKQQFGLVASLAAVGATGLILSLGPLLKLKGGYAYGDLHVAFPMPYLFIDKFIPQLTFIRAVGRWSVLFLFALCALLAYGAFYMTKYAPQRRWYNRHSKLIGLAVMSLLFIELMPTGQVHMSGNSYSYNLHVPQVYRYIKAHPEVDDIIVLRGDEDYPKAPIPVVRAEDVLWSGYHNRNIFNGYSGYTPPEYFIQYGDFKDFEPADHDIDKMKALGLRYMVVDKQLSTNRPHLAEWAKQRLPNKLYEDERYVLYRL